MEQIHGIIRPVRESESEQPLSVLCRLLCDDEKDSVDIDGVGYEHRARRGHMLAAFDPDDERHTHAAQNRTHSKRSIQPFCLDLTQSLRRM